MLGVADRRNARTVSIGSMADATAKAAANAAEQQQATMALLGEAQLTNFYNDGNKGTGTAAEMGLEERQLLAVEGIVIAAVDVVRDPALVRAVAEAAHSSSSSSRQVVVAFLSVHSSASLHAIQLRWFS